MCKRILTALFFAAFAASAQTQELPKRYQITESPKDTPKETPKETPTATPAAAGQTIQVDVSGATQWTDTGIDLLPGARVQITATGSLQYDQLASPDGLT